VILSFLKRGRERTGNVILKSFRTPNVSDQGHKRSKTLMELSETIMQTLRNGERSGTNSGKKSRSRFKLERITVFNNVELFRY